jgi:hypothetical protein
VRLHELEAQFYRAVRGELSVAALEATFVSRAALDAQRRMRIYQHAYWARQERVLAATFPRLRAHLGDARFARLSADYLRRVPSRRPEIEWLGSRLADLLCEQADVAPFLRDLARLEWARWAALLAPAPEDPAALSALAGIDFAAARAALAPGLSLLCVAGQALRAFHEDVAPCDLASEAAQVPCLVWRKGHNSCHRSLGASEHEALNLVRAGHPFSDVCGLFGEVEEAAACIGRWLRDGLLTSLRCVD